jgi:hypothetical protein
VISGFGAEGKCWRGSLPAAIDGIPENICSSRVFLELTHSGHGSRATCRFGVNLDAKSKCILAESQAWIEDNQERHQNDRSHDHGANL